MMILLGLFEWLNSELRNESLVPCKDESKYAIPPKTICDGYDEMYREYEIFGGKIFTVMIRNTRSDGKYWVRCGYKDTADSRYVGGIEDRDCSTYSMDDVINHCKNNFRLLLDQKGW
jgi:hypothetical protein